MSKPVRFVAGEDIKAGELVTLNDGGQLVRAPQPSPPEAAHQGKMDEDDPVPYIPVGITELSNPYDGFHWVVDNHDCGISGLHFHGEDKSKFYRAPVGTHWKVGNECKVVLNLEGGTAICLQHRFDAPQEKGEASPSGQNEEFNFQITEVPRPRSKPVERIDPHNENSRGKCPHGYEEGDHHWYGCMGVDPFEEPRTQDENKFEFDGDACPECGSKLFFDPNDQEYHCKGSLHVFMHDELDELRHRIEKNRNSREQGDKPLEEDRLPGENIVDYQTRMLRTNGYKANCDKHGNQVFPWNPVTQHHNCPYDPCPASVCDWRTCDQHQPGMTSTFWHCTTWKNENLREGMGASSLGRRQVEEETRTGKTEHPAGETEKTRTQFVVTQSAVDAQEERSKELREELMRRRQREGRSPGTW